MSDEPQPRPGIPSSPDDPSDKPSGDAPGSSAGPGDDTESSAPVEGGSDAKPAGQPDSGAAPESDAPPAPAPAAETPAAPAPGADTPGAPETEADIDLSDGKTLSDYLEDDAKPAPPPKAPEARSIPNVEKLKVPPPPGVARPRAGTSPGADAEPAEGEFGRMLEASLKARTFEDGETVKGRIVAIGPDVAFLDVGGKSEATIDLGELKDDEGDLEVEVGETIEALVVSSEGGLKLSRRLARGAAAKEQLADAFRAGLPVEGRVEKVIKGGYEVRIAGQRGFCPISQIDSSRTADPAVHEGKVYAFRIIEFKDGGKNLVLSRRALLQEEERAKAEETRKAIVAGAVLKGRVASVREYGAFVDLGGIQGLLHVSEMEWSRTSAPSDIVKPGDEITVKVLKVDEQKGKISLGMKQLQDDPWSKVIATYSVGQIVKGRVARLQDFGAFVELEPGIEALAHVSTFPPTGTPDGWKKTAPAGTTADFEVLTIDAERKRIGVAMVPEGSTRSSVHAGEGETVAEGRPRTGDSQRPQGAPRVAIRAGARMKGKVERHESFGVFIYLAPGKTGLLPISESATARGTDLKKAFPIGEELEVMVIEVEQGGRRIRLSRKALIEHEEKSDAREFASRKQESGAFGSSLADKLRAALAAKKN